MNWKGWEISSCVII